jgi:CRP/FNR family transcriptional regulator
MLDLALLRRHPVLAHVSSDALELIGGRGMLRRWTARQVIFRRGDAAYGMVLILSGRVRVVRERDGRRQVLHIEEAGGTLGEVPLFDGGPMPATAVAVEPTEGVVLSPELVRAVVARDPALALVMLARMARRVRTLADRVERLTLHGVGMRLAAALLERAHRAPGHPLSLGMSQEQFAEELGTVREVLVRELRGLVQAGILAPLGAGRYALQQPEALSRIAAGELWNPGS